MKKEEVTVKSLRQNGWKVRVTHLRFVTKNGELESTFEIRNFNKEMMQWLETKGGKTIVDLRSPAGLEVSAEAECSKKENFNRKMGLQIALNRALKKVTCI